MQLEYLILQTKHIESMCKDYLQKQFLLINPYNVSYMNDHVVFSYLNYTIRSCYTHSVDVVVVVVK